MTINRKCSRESDFQKHLAEMKTWLLDRSYPLKLVKSEIRKAKFHKVRQCSNQNQSQKGFLPPVATYHPLLKLIGYIIKKHEILFMDDEVKHVCSPKLMVSFLSTRKISSTLLD